MERSLFVGEFTLSSGIRSTYYVDARRTTMSAEGQFLIGRVCLETVRKQGWGASHVGGLTLGADPIAYAIAHASWAETEGAGGGTGASAALDAFTVRKVPKTHGTAQRIEGGLPTGARCVVIEDSMTSGGSALDAVRSAQQHGAVVAGVLTLVDRQEGGRERILSETGLEVVSVFTARELLDAARSASASS